MEQSIRCVAAGGNINAIGVLSGTTDQGSGAGQAIALSLIRKNATLKGINVGPKDRTEEMIKIVYGPNEISPVIDRVFGFEEAKEALDYLYGGSHLGKVIIRVD
jgi:NADPH:quinone reductase-like Zn-dependent oxidoreductase